MWKIWRERECVPPPWPRRARGRHAVHNKFVNVCIGSTARGTKEWNHSAHGSLYRRGCLGTAERGASVPMPVTVPQVRSGGGGVPPAPAAARRGHVGQRQVLVADLGARLGGGARPPGCGAPLDPKQKHAGHFGWHGMDISMHGSTAANARLAYSGGAYLIRASASRWCRRATACRRRPWPKSAPPRQQALPRLSTVNV